MNCEQLWKLLELRPICEEGWTIYGTVMCPATSFYQTRLGPAPMLKGKKAKKSGKKKSGRRKK